LLTFNFCSGFCVIKRQMQGENMSQCHPLANVFNAADAGLERKSRQNVDCQQTLGCVAQATHVVGAVGDGGKC
ncbi:hypothetical protein, partial [Neisseria bacilliformis]|uniref:hypothetical protein n=1 Tax=Neisseria bacilliformis TaxID=267212 RepID=UPI0019552BCD